MSALIGQFIKLQKFSDLTKQFAEVVDQIIKEKEAIEKCGNDFFLMYGHVKKKEELERERDKIKAQFQNLK